MKSDKVIESDRIKRVDEKYINGVINLKGFNGKPIDIFKLHGLLFVGNVENGKYDLRETYSRYSEHTLGICAADFEDCETPDEIKDRFGEVLSDAVSEQL
jgi:hypothetical protein